ncbi:acyl-CoA dehydrogenase family protein [Mycolicibacterium tokaiense]|uniref:Acyl-CoA dehydrogenase FadE n=1 Tax=Mycolicibacterium tokaiense TaxID=39695 RepID=A0A378T800_9MYCO|nr:acyl-CoA dehydrogenase family protein [Mycolicibacterium tokaiense]BBY88535.1 acyl-CoA dehydrogenase [Mycolicibacterium tokaiense]STZ56942.1 acyl-CoA dehydrogenase FadE [Mycolicibacterium tokaiense]
MHIDTRRWRSLEDANLTDQLRQFVAAEVDPRAEELDRDDRYPDEIIAMTAARGWNSLTLPHDVGGGASSMSRLLTVFEELSVGSAIVGISLITIFQSQKLIDAFGSASLRQRLLPRYRDGMRAAYALTERAHGSDIRSLDTKAARQANGSWHVRGQKAFITSGSAADLFVVLAETDAGVSVFAVPRETTGLHTEETAEAQTFGLRNGPHVDLHLDCLLPPDALIGEEGRGLKQAMVTLANSRVLAAGISLGIARAAFDAALQYAIGRSAFSSRVIDFQGIQWYFAEAAARIDAARLLTHQAACDLDAGRDIARSSSEAKLFASSVATEVAEMAVQVCGAHGTRTSSPFGRYLRDAKTYEIAGGSSEILKNTIAKSLIGAR